MTESSQEAANASADAGLGEEGKSIVSKNFSIVGDLTCEDFLQIDGSVEGNIACRQLSVSESGKINGDIRADTVEMCGTLTGAIDARVLTLSKSSNVVGDIVVQESLGIEPGASFDGSCKKLGSSENAGEDDAAGTTTSEPMEPEKTAGETPTPQASKADADAAGETVSQEPPAPETPAPEPAAMASAGKAENERIPGVSMQSALDKVAAELKATMSLTGAGKMAAAPAGPPTGPQEATPKAAAPATKPAVNAAATASAPASTSATPPPAAPAKTASPLEPPVQADGTAEPAPAS